MPTSSAHSKNLAILRVSLCSTMMPRFLSVNWSNLLEFNQLFWKVLIPVVLRTGCCLFPTLLQKNRNMFLIKRSPFICVLILKSLFLSHLFQHYLCFLEPKQVKTFWRQFCCVGNLYQWHFMSCLGAADVLLLDVFQLVHLNRFLTHKHTIFLFTPLTLSTFSPSTPLWQALGPAAPGL